MAISPEDLRDKFYSEVEKKANLLEDVIDDLLDDNYSSQDRIVVNVGKSWNDRPVLDEIRRRYLAVGWKDVTWQGSPKEWDGDGATLEITLHKPEED